MNILFFKTDISSPIGIQAIWDTLKSIEVTNFNIDFSDINKVLKISTEKRINAKAIIHSLNNIGYSCEELLFNPN